MKQYPVFISLVLVIMCLSFTFLSAEPYFLLDSEIEWSEALLSPMPERNRILRGNPMEWEDYMEQRELYLYEGEQVPRSVFLPPDLYVYPGDPGNPEYPDEPGLVMAWGEGDLLEGDYSSAWKFQYGVDPDLTNCTITLKVHPPLAINMVSFGLTDLEGDQCSWTWFVPANIPSTPPNPATTITINTNNIPGLGVNSSAPAAASFSYNPNFNINKVVSIFINETFHNTPGVFPPPPPGGGSLKFYWNAWDEFSVTPNNGGGGQVNSKWFVKWSQPPDDKTYPGMINGWDEHSLYFQPPIMADDWKCKDNRPVTDIHWWGSFYYQDPAGGVTKCWSQPYIPPHMLPKGFHIGIWTDVPVGPDNVFSHPGRLIWENYCTSYVWNFAGYDYDPRIDVPDPREREACFQFAQFLSQNEWFRQEPGPEDGTVYWLSIAAFYDPGTNFEYLWGWKTRPKFFNDDAVRMYDIMEPTGLPWQWGMMPTQPWPSHIGATWMHGMPVEAAVRQGDEIVWLSWDLAFELTTNEPSYEDNPIPGDLDVNKKVDLIDFAIFASHWLEVSP